MARTKYTITEYALMEDGSRVLIDSVSEKEYKDFLILSVMKAFDILLDESKLLKLAG